jgi:hypothetical protein
MRGGVFAALDELEIGPTVPPHDTQSVQSVNFWAITTSKRKGSK